MKFAFCLPTILLAAFAFAAPPASTAQASYELEELRRLAGQLEDLRSAYEAQQRKISSLQNQVDTLRNALRQANDSTSTKLSEFVTRDDLKKLGNAIEEVDKNRISDRNLILEEFKKEITKLGSTARPAAVKQNTEETLQGTFYEHTVKSGEYLSAILDAYNAAFKEKGKGQISMEDIRKANPKVNINRIYVGQKILIPDPSEKR